MDTHIWTLIYGHSYMDTHIWTLIYGHADEDHLGKRFNLRAVLESFEDPRSPLFTESLEAEMRKCPELTEMTPEIVERDPPKILFTSRRVGYFKCPNLCRVWLLDILRWLRARGETFVQWKDPTSGQSYDGLFVLAHAVTIKYSSMHKPGRCDMSCI